MTRTQTPYGEVVTFAPAGYAKTAAPRFAPGHPLVEQAKAIARRVARPVEPGPGRLFHLNHRVVVQPADAQQEFSDDV